ncbi:MAG: hypothetical protein PHV30_09720 [Candidatus Margulisbacteria bacterium]|nr:hypothetical protein [Candidatus Margulisiibacteriota bacterium]
MKSKIISQLTAKDRLFLMVCKTMTDEGLDKLLIAAEQGVPGKLALLKELYEKGIILTEKQLIKIAVNYQEDKKLLKDLINSLKFSLRMNKESADYAFDLMLPVIEKIDINIWMGINANISSQYFHPLHLLIQAFAGTNMKENHTVYSAQELVPLLKKDAERLRKLFDKTFSLLHEENKYTQRPYGGYDHALKNILVLCADTGKLTPNQYVQLIIEHDDSLFFLNENAREEAIYQLGFLINRGTMDDKKLNRLFNKLFEHYKTCTETECSGRILYLLVDIIKKGNIKNLSARQIFFNRSLFKESEIAQALINAKCGNQV